MKKEWLIKTLSMGIVILFIGAGAVSALNINLIDESKPLRRSNTLYVGGSGPNNYTKIQDAIDDASIVDTIFVYQGTYHENLVIDKSLTLYGEDKNKTIIDGSSHGNAIYILTNRVTITGFTVTNAGYGHYAGIWLENVRFNKIVGNIISDNHYWGICLNSSSLNSISENNISMNNLGIEAGGDPQKPSNGNIFKNNVFFSNDYYGIGFGWSKGNLFYQNIFLNSPRGISFWHNNFNIIYKNVFTDNNLGIKLHFSKHNLILFNNFINNEKNADFLIDNLIQNNRYLGNYWNESTSKPFIIHGGLVAFNRSFSNPFSWIQIDWFPAKEPYVISIEE